MTYAMYDLFPSLFSFFHIFNVTLGQTYKCAVLLIPISPEFLKFSRLIEERCTNNMHPNLLISDFIITNDIKIKATNKRTLITVVLNFIMANICC